MFEGIGMENDAIQIPDSIKSKPFLKRQAHCGECARCFYDSFSRRNRCCINGRKIIELRTFACGRFYYKFADMNPNWENKFLFTDKRTW